MAGAGSMLVEIQLIDTVFLDIKLFMHRPYSVGRGDFGAMPVLGLVIHGGIEGEVQEQKNTRRPDKGKERC